jgi:hypothetical protein
MINTLNVKLSRSKLLLLIKPFRTFPRNLPVVYSKMASDTETTMMTVDEMISTLKTFETTELFKLIKAATTEVEKKSKTPKKGGAGDTSVSRKKAGSMPKGTIPPQLKKPRAWVEFTLKHALENGWEAFTVVQKKKDKESNTITEEQIEMPASELHDGAYIFEGSVTEKTPQGRQLIHKEAMSLSKQRKDANHPTYAEFDAQYVDDSSDDESVTSSTSSKKIVVKKTAAEKEAEAEAKRAEKEAEKEAKRVAKELEKEAKKAEKEAEKAAKKASAEQKKETKKPVATKAPVPAKAVEAEAKPVVKKKAVKA